MINNTSGFTLIEFMVATLILMVGLLGLLQVINVAMERNLETAFRNEAIVIADDIMMTQRGKNFDSIVSLPKELVSPTAVNFKRDVKVGNIFKRYFAAVTVTNPTANSKQISVDLTWKYKSIDKSHQVSSAVSKLN